MKTNRGGDITYHGPRQLVCYPIIDLENFYRDIHKYLRDLEEIIVETLIYFGIKASGNTNETGVWLDVGFGNGSLLFTAEEYGYEPIGVDLRKENVNILQGVGIQAYCNLVQDIEFAKPISVVSMMDVLEHIPFPKDVLISLHSKMGEDGCLLISMPNSETMIWRHLTAQNTNPFFGSIEHCHNFSKTRLESLLNECGFSIKRYGISERYLSCMEVVAQKS